MKRYLQRALLGVLLFPGVNQAAELGYTYVEAGYAETELDDVDADGEGYFVAGSVALAPNWHIVADYATADLDAGGGPVDVDVDTLSVGFGYNYPINERADFIGRLLYVQSDFEIDTPGASIEGDDDGYGLQARLRGEVVERLELEGGIDYVDLGDEETTLVVEGRYFLTDRLAIGAALESGDDATAYGVALRLEF